MAKKSIKLYGDTYTMEVRNPDVGEIHTRLGKSPLAGNLLEDLSPDDLTFILWVTLKRHHSGLSESDVNELIDPCRYTVIMMKLDDLFTPDMDDEDEAFIRQHSAKVRRLTDLAESSYGLKKEPPIGVATGDAGAAGDQVDVALRDAGVKRRKARRGPAAGSPFDPTKSTRQ